MMAAGRKDNAEAQRTRSFAEQEHEMPLPRGSADFAEVWESNRYGGLGTSWIALLCGREVEVRPGFYRGPAAAVNSGECAVPVRGDGSPVLPGRAAKDSADARGPRTGDRIHGRPMLVKHYY